MLRFEILLKCPFIATLLVILGFVTIPHNKLSPITERNLNILAKSPVKLSNCKEKEISATINIITNPNADFSDEPVWQINPVHFQSMKHDLEKFKLQQKSNAEQQC
jgi:hypothetical protein